MLMSTKLEVQQLENKHSISDNLADEEFQDINLYHNDKTWKLFKKNDDRS